jgi:mannitol-1-phosphate 5-dehydrogenase
VRAVVLGPGRIGCGFAGQLLRASGYEVTFAGRMPTIDRLRRLGRYRVRLVLAGSVRESVVDGVRALPVADHAGVGAAIRSADVVATAVGASNLGAVAPLLALGLQGRRAPLNVIAFENLCNAGPHLRDEVGLHLPRGFPLHEHGFSGAVVSRAVAHRIVPDHPDHPLLFVGDPPSTFTVDRCALRAPLPAITGMIAADDYEAWLHRKLYVYSAGHAATAYLGYLKGYHYIHSAIRDPEIRAAVRAAMAEGQRGLAARYGSVVAGGERELDAILARFENAALNDSIGRVGRDPRRKLAADDRLVGAARLAAASGASPEKLLLAVAAALYFCDPVDVLAAALHREIERCGLELILATVCGLEPNRGLGRIVLDRWRALSPGWGEGNLLLHLEAPMWAWTSDRAA